jgi:molybdenum cofactor cytidylyltransferase
MPEQPTCGLVLLAAGASLRMGRPKQVLPVYGRPLVRHMAEIALAGPVSPIVVVLGAHKMEVAEALRGLPLQLAVNEAWAEGMGSSLRKGVEVAVTLEPRLAGIIVALADQPNLTTAHLERLIVTQSQTGRSVVVSESDGTLMPPVLFSALHFPDLLAWRGDKGARLLWQSLDVAPAVVSAGAVQDIDTPADYADFIRRQSSGQRDI